MDNKEESVDSTEEQMNYRKKRKVEEITESINYKNWYEEQANYIDEFEREKRYERVH